MNRAGDPAPTHRSADDLLGELTVEVRDGDQFFHCAGVKVRYVTPRCRGGSAWFTIGSEPLEQGRLGFDFINPLGPRSRRLGPAQALFGEERAAQVYWHTPAKPPLQLPTPPSDRHPDSAQRPP
ncbi:hypothetical protein T261_0307 [Streptomyces lydicus]|nr:hypothetical protein T261_0307 [Streptomyces lydicus]